MTPTGQSDPQSTLDLVNLSPLMALGSGIPEVVIGLIDGPVAVNHPDLVDATWRTIGDQTEAPGFARQHGTFVAGILAAKRGSAAPAICPGCTFLIRPVFAAGTSTSPKDLAKAISDCIEAGARILNISAAIVRSEPRAETCLKDSLHIAAKRGALVVSAAGNQSALGGTSITGSLWVIPVSACDRHGRPLTQSNLGISIGKRGLLAPGAGIKSIGATGGLMTGDGTSAAAPFVAGTIALLWSLFPGASGIRIKQALTRAEGHRRNSVVPPLLNAWDAYQALAGRYV